ncbi:MAG: hypothetical protein R3C61_23020 [Bacteroidia bacterium]
MKSTIPLSGSDGNRFAMKQRLVCFKKTTSFNRVADGVTKIERFAQAFLKRICFYNVRLDFDGVADESVYIQEYTSVLTFRCSTLRDLRSGGV